MERKPAPASVVQTVSAARIQSLNGRVAPTGGPGNGENTTPKSIIDLLLVHEQSRCCHTLLTQLHHELQSLPVAFPSIPTPTLDDPEAVRANHVLKCVCAASAQISFCMRAPPPALR